MEIVDRIEAVAASTGDRVAHRHRDVTLTYGHLWSASGALAARLAGALPDDGSPIVVYGHKESSMLVAFLGAVRAAHPYIPVDASWPADRIASVIAESRTGLVIAVRPLPEGVATSAAVLDGSGLASGSLPDGPAGSPHPVTGADPYYVIYTSGSTGRPKGVQITAGALGHFVDWALTLAEIGVSVRASASESRGVASESSAVPERRSTLDHSAPEVWLNQAPFSFDLSVMDLYGALASGGTLHSLDAATVGNPRHLYDDLAASDLTIWVSTPSFADLCLADPSFDAALLPRLRLFLFCGETLPPTTAETLLERFPGAQVVNTYGPTESTVAVTSVVIGPEHLDGTALPVGVAKPGTTILIRDDAGTVLPPGQPGEIVIAGDTVSIGYLHRPDLTEAAFTLVEVNGSATPAYRTGDLGHLDEHGMLHFGGRLDGQVKLHGYRIELEDVENNLRRVDEVQQVAVVAVRNDAGTITHLHAFVQLASVPDGSPLAVATALKKRLRAYVPDYMVPKVITVVDRIPMTGNGKADRNLLALRHGQLRGPAQGSVPEPVEGFPEPVEGSTLDPEGR
jgi:D-alanine--poly(phosphoribitol) ligase subunit 1